MKARPLILLAIVLIVLVGLKLMQDASHRAETSQSGLEELLGELPAAQIGRLVITGPGGEDLILVRKGAEWQLESSYGHPASATNVQRLLDALAGLKGEFRSEKAEVLVDYGLDEAQAVRMVVSDLEGQERARLLIGNQVEGGSAYFLCREGEERAFAAQGALLSSLGIWGENRDPEGKRFLDLKIFTVERDDVDSLLVADGEQGLTLVKAFTVPAADSLPVDRSQFAWLANGKAADKSAADGVLGALSSVYARDILDPAGDYGFAETRRRVEVVLADGRRRSLEFGNAVTEPEEGLAMRIVGEDFVYLVYSNLSDRIFKSPADFEPAEG